MREKRQKRCRYSKHSKCIKCKPLLAGCQMELCNYTNIDKMYGWCSLFLSTSTLNKLATEQRKRHFSIYKAKIATSLFITFLPAFKCSCIASMVTAINDKIQTHSNGFGLGFNFQLAAVLRANVNLFNENLCILFF